MKNPIIYSQHITIGESNFDLFIIFADKQIIASAQCQFTDMFCAIARIFVSEEFRTKGYARMLLSEIERQAKRRVLIACHLMVEEATRPTLWPFYMKLGYTPVYQFPDGDVIFSKTL